jgi:hypothetical protein
MSPAGGSGAKLKSAGGFGEAFYFEVGILEQGRGLIIENGFLFSQE